MTEPRSAARTLPILAAGAAGLKLKLLGARAAGVAEPEAPKRAEPRQAEARRLDALRDPLSQVSEVRRGCIQVAKEADVAEPVVKPPEDREVLGLDALLEGIAFSLGQTPGGYGLVDAVAERLLQRAAELARRDAELFGSVVDDRLAFLARRT